MELKINTRDDLPAELNRLGFLNGGVEVGVLQGDFAEKILRVWKGRRLYLVDAWRPIPGLKDANNHELPVQHENIKKTAERIAPFDDRAVIIRDYSVNAANLFPDGVLDFVYIDAAHDYKNVSADLVAWVPKVRHGGLVIGDDYTYGTWGSQDDPSQRHWTDFEVKPAVDDFVRVHGFALHTSRETKPQWWFFKA